MTARRAATTTGSRQTATRVASGPTFVVLARVAACSGDQLVQLSVAGLVVAVAAPPEAVTPVRAGIEKKVFSHGFGAAAGCQSRT